VRRPSRHWYRAVATLVGVDEIELLDGVFAKTGAIIATVRPDQLEGPTPCPDYSVGQLVDHIVGWVHVFAGAACGEPFNGDPTAYRPGDEPGREFAEAARNLCTGWRELGLDRSVRLSAGELPGQMVFNMTLMEYMAHGWDLAKATRQQIPFTDKEASEVLARAEATLPAQYRGEGKAFGVIVEVPANATSLDRFVGFMGRRP
jgi:uncharacterized protein (TIGR03086 family)